MQTTQCPEVFVTYREGFSINKENKNTVFVYDEPLFTQSSMCSPLVFDYAKNQHYFPSQKEVFAQYNFGTVDYDAQMNTKLVFVNNHVIKPMTF